MEDISNKTLAILVAIAIVVGIVGLFTISPTKIYQATGRAGTTQTGTTALNITNVVSITLTTSTVDFGSGYVNASIGKGWCWAATDENLPVDGDYCVGMNQHPNPFTLENDGNVAITVQMNSTDDASSLLGGSEPYFQTRVYDNEAGSCTLGTLTTYTDITTTPITLCSSLNYADSSDTIDVEMYIQFTSDASPGVRTATLTFTATEA